MSVTPCIASPIGNTFTQTIVDYIYPPMRIVSRTKMGVIESLEALWKKIWQGSNPEQCIDILLKGKTILIEGSKSFAERIEAELIDMAYHPLERVLLTRAITDLQSKKILLTIAPIPNEKDSSSVEFSPGKNSIFLQMTSNGYLHILQRPDGQHELAPLDPHADLVHEFGHIDGGWITSSKKSVIWTDPEEERVITTIQNPCLRERNENIRISHKRLKITQKEYEELDISSKLEQTFKHAADASFRKLCNYHFSPEKIPKDINPKSLTIKFKNLIHYEWTGKPITTEDKDHYAQARKIKEQLLREYEINPQFKFDESSENSSQAIWSLLIYTTRKPNWNKKTLRNFLKKNFPNINVKNREAYIRLFQDVKFGHLAAKRTTLEKAFAGKKYYWNNNTRIQCIDKAISWVLTFTVEELPKMDFVKLDQILSKEFPDLPKTEKESLFKLLKQGDMFESSLASTGSTPSIHLKKDWSIRNSIKAMEKASRPKSVR